MIVPSPRRWPSHNGFARMLFVWSFLLLAFLFTGCEDDNGIQPGSLRFGQVGEIRVTLVVPLLFNGTAGELQQILTWSSTGAWQLRENISYRGLPGDEQLRRSTGDSGAFASFYAELITQLNESPGLKLFVPQLDPTLDPDCSAGGTRISFLIRDQIRGETVTWVRCAEGSLGTLNTAEAAPDPEAVRVIQAAILVRDYTHSDGFTSAYIGSVPFGTLDRGEDSGARLPRSRVFLSQPEGSIATPPEWNDFWRTHKGNPAAVPPPVDWRTEMVLVAAVGERIEAGDSIEIRRVLQTGEGTQVTLFERVPGDFCSPASRSHYPIHIIVAPRTREPIFFAEVVKERVSCGS